MPVPALILGQLAAPLVPHLLRFAHEKGVPAIEKILSDPAGYASRIGDIIVWNGSSGQHVLAGLQSVGESQQRIEQAINIMEGTQLATQATLSGLQLVSFASFGVTSLTGAAMIWRLEALNRRFDRLSQQVHDLEDNLDAQNKAHLRNAIQNLREFDDTENPQCLSRAKDEAQHAANVYGQLTYKECQSPNPRLKVLNYRGRCYVLSLVTELRARLLDGSTSGAIARFNEEKETIVKFAGAVFETATGPVPAAFLSEEMKSEGATLELMTELYQAAQRFGVFTEAHIQTPSDMFEYYRSTGIPGRSFFKWGAKQNVQLLGNRLKYLMGCFEDLGRVESLKLIAEELQTKKIPFSELQEQLKDWCSSAGKDHDAASVFAYSFQ